MMWATRVVRVVIVLAEAISELIGGAVKLSEDSFSRNAAAPAPDA
jgi:hypothetical protein